MHTMKKPVAAIDIGSNTLRLMVAELTEYPPHWRIKAYRNRITRLGEGLHGTGLLQDEAMQRALKGLKEFADIVKSLGIAPQHVAAVATAAVRTAENGDRFLDQVRALTGIRPRKISGDEEAGLSLQGAIAVLREEYCNDLLLIDIGGGSTEFICADSGRLRNAISRNLGVVRLVNCELRTDPPSAEEYGSILEICQAHLRKVETSWTDHRIPKTLAGTAGTVTTLAALHLNLFPYEAERINNHVISRKAFMQLKERLLCMTCQQRSALPTVEEGRADLIIAGLAIIETIMEQWHFNELVAVDAGLLEGVWLNASPLICGSDREKAPPA